VSAICCDVIGSVKDAGSMRVLDRNCFLDIIEGRSSPLKTLTDNGLKTECYTL
jgi:hypothetical protein